MASVTVRFWGTLRQPGQRQLRLDLPTAAVLRDVVDRVAAELEGDTEANARDIIAFCTFVQNGDAVPPNLGLDTPVEDGDILAFVPAMSGGQR